MKGLWRHVGPWLTIVLVAVEIVLVWTGVLSLLNAVIIIVVVEALLVVTALGRGVVGVRAFRAGRVDGRDSWTAVEEGLAEMVPPRLARILLIEARMWVSFVRWITCRRPVGRVFGYGASLRTILWIVLSLLMVEGAVVEVILVAMLGQANPWVWIALGLHVYGLVWIGGFLGSMSVLPHQLEPTALVLRDSVFTTIAVPLTAITSVTQRRHPHTGRSGFTVEDGTGLLAHGDVTVRITLHPDAAVWVCGQPRSPRLRRIDLTADEPGGVRPGGGRGARAGACSGSRRRPLTSIDEVEKPLLVEKPTLVPLRRGSLG